MLKWDMYSEVAEKMKRKVPDPERQDIKQEIITRLAERDCQTEALAYCIANETTVEYWRRERYRQMDSLDWLIFDPEGNPLRVIDILEAHEANLDDLAFSKELLANLPVRVVKIASRRLAGYPISRADAKYLERWRINSKTKQLRLALK